MQTARALEIDTSVLQSDLETVAPLTSLELEAIAGGAVICNDD